MNVSCDTMYRLDSEGVWSQVDIVEEWIVRSNPNKHLQQYI